MTFGEKLSFLIQHFNSSNSKLAKAITIDPSLVSKWVNGKRIPPLNSPYIIQIAEYFIRIPSREYQQASLLELLKAEVPDHNLDLDTGRVTALIKWLTSQIMPLPESDKTCPVDCITADSLNRVINSMGETSGEKCYYELFKGSTGQRQAVINFMQFVLDSKQPAELLLASQEDIMWILEDVEFLSQWAFMLKEILSRDHRITIIHTVNRDIHQISTMINYWIPLNLTEKIKSYYQPKYEGQAFVKTIFVARGIAAILSTSAQGRDAVYTFQFRDPLVIDLLEQNFRSYLME